MMLKNLFAVIFGMVLGTLLVTGTAQASTAKIKCLIVNGTRVKIELEGEDLTPGTTYSGWIKNKTTLTKRFREFEKPSDDFGHAKFKYDNVPLENKAVIPPDYAQIGHAIRGIVKSVAPGTGVESLVAAASTTCVAKTSGGGGNDDGSNHQ